MDINFFKSNINSFIPDIIKCDRQSGLISNAGDNFIKLGPDGRIDLHSYSLLQGYDPGHLDEKRHLYAVLGSYFEFISQSAGSSLVNVLKSVTASTDPNYLEVIELEKLSLDTDLISIFVEQLAHQSELLQERKLENQVQLENYLKRLDQLTEEFKTSPDKNYDQIFFSLQMMLSSSRKSLADLELGIYELEQISAGLLQVADDLEKIDENPAPPIPDIKPLKEFDHAPQNTA